MICGALYDEILCEATPHKQWGRVDERGKNFTAKQTYNVIEYQGYTLSRPFHASGIGNNNERAIIRRCEYDGFTFEAVIGYLVYNYDIYCRLVHIVIEDKDHEVYWRAKDYFPRLHSEDE
jgi:hypothetical protein